jgi:hypothetical protein
MMMWDCYSGGSDRLFTGAHPVRTISLYFNLACIRMAGDQKMEAMR